MGYQPRTETGTTLVQRILQEQGPRLGDPRTGSGWDRTRHAAVNCHLYSEPLNLTTYTNSMEQLTVHQLVKKSPAFCWTPRFVTVRTTAYHLTLFSLQPRILFFRFHINIILPSTPRSGLLTLQSQPRYPVRTDLQFGTCYRSLEDLKLQYKSTIPRAWAIVGI
jgi:hypothetical protein